jgi:hypothetical protein
MKFYSNSWMIINIYHGSIKVARDIEFIPLLATLLINSFRFANLVFVMVKILLSTCAVCLGAR